MAGPGPELLSVWWLRCTSGNRMSYFYFPSGCPCLLPPADAHSQRSAPLPGLSAVRLTFLVGFLLVGSCVRWTVRHCKQCSCVCCKSPGVHFRALWVRTGQGRAASCNCAGDRVLPPGVCEAPHPADVQGPRSPPGHREPPPPPPGQTGSHCSAGWHFPVMDHSERCVSDDPSQSFSGEVSVNLCSFFTGLLAILLLKNMCTSS